MAEYTMPIEIKEKLTDEFYSTMWEELINVFGDNVKGFTMTLDGKDDYPSVYDVLGTSGWGTALHRTCEKLNLQDLWAYWLPLKWYDSDQFDDIILTELAKRFSRKTNGDCIRSMSDEELAVFLSQTEEHLFTGNLWSIKTWNEWLKKEVDDG